jgi:hypothetical protein
MSVNKDTDVSTGQKCYHEEVQRRVVTNARRFTILEPLELLRDVIQLVAQLFWRTDLHRRAWS